MAAYSLIKTVNTGDTITAVDRNNEHQNHINNNTVSGVTGDSANVTAMQTTVDPGGVGTESLATTLQGEIERLRFVLTKIHGGAQWYAYPATNALLKGGGTMSGAIAMGSNKITGLPAASANGDAVRYEQVLTGQIVGTTTNDNASAGNVGEYVASVVNSGSTVSVANTDTFTNITSISLTAGDWDIQGHIVISIGTLSSVTSSRIALSTNSGNTQTDHVVGDNQLNGGNFASSSTSMILTCSRWRQSLSATTTVYLKSAITATSGSGAVYGKISARRVR